MKMNNLLRYLWIGAIGLSAASTGTAADWPAYRHDSRRSGAAAEQIDAARLRQQWVWKSSQPPRPAWAGVAAVDAYHGITGLVSMRDYDPVFHVAAAGGCVYFGSSADDSVRCLDAATGKVKWVYTTDAPVRIAPTVAGGPSTGSGQGNVYFGSDDGYAYCVTAEDGKLLWKFSPTADERRILHDGRMISLRPCRTGVVVEGGTAYFAASMLPWEDSFLCAVDAKSGQPTGPGRYVSLQEIVSLEGPMVASADRLFQSQGRVAPKVFDRADGKAVGDLPAAGGSFLVLTDDSRLLQGYGTTTGYIAETDATTGRRAGTIGRGRDMVVSGGAGYVLTGRNLGCTDRKTGQARWSKPLANFRAIILAGDTVFAGGDDRVTAFKASDGAELWTHQVRGRAYGLAAADGKLIVSTDEGYVYCFAPAGGAAGAEAGASDKAQPMGPVDPQPITLAMGPYLQFAGADTAEVRWETAEPSATIIEYGIGEQFRKIEVSGKKTSHSAKLTGLKRNSTYTYIIRATVGDKLRSTAAQTFDTFFNYSVPGVPDGPSPFPSDELSAASAAAAEQILSATGVTDGVCLVLGSGEGRLAYELARRSRLRVIGVDSDAAAVAAARRALLPTGAYGVRVAIHHVASLDELPFVGDFANLIVSDRLLWTGRCAGSAVEMLRVLKPGGAAYLGGPAAAPGKASEKDLRAWFAAASLEPKIAEVGGGLWASFVRPPAKGAGAWSHQYGLADNAAFGGETLEGARTTSQLRTQWLGRPGPRYQPDRSGRKPAPLAVNGRLFGQGLKRIVAMDAWNGSILWSLEIPQFGRFNIPRDTGNWCADDDHVFAAVGNRCWQIDAATGGVAKTHSVVPGSRGGAYDWGYVGRHGNYLIGSAERAGSAYMGYWGGGGWYDSRDTTKVCSDNLFAIEKSSGQRAWTYTGGAIINSTITAAEGCVYFIESRNPAAIASGGRNGRDIWSNQFMVALDVKTGKKSWEKPFACPGGSIVYYLAHSGKMLVLVASAGWSYHVYGFDANGGEQKWHVTFSNKGDHGAHMSRPAIVGGQLFVRPKIIDLATGKVSDDPMPGGGCGTYSMSKHAAFFRAVHTTMWSFDAGKTSNWLRLRPGCWLSTIPACGMLLSPEASGGCTCGQWMETSIGFAPETDVPVFETLDRTFAASLDVRIEKPLGGGEVHYTLDGTRPTARSARYTEPIKLTKTAVVRACAVSGGLAGKDVSMRYELVVAKSVRECTVNFQPAGEAPKGCLADSGEPFGIRPSGYAYGWSGPMQAATRRRGRTGDPMLDTQIFFMPGIVWTIAVDNGTYEVTVSIGDAAYPISDGTIYVCGVEFCKGVRLDQESFKQITKDVVVRDGKVTVSSSLQAAPADRTRMNYVKIRRK
ncbi:MAG TPA: PQQ-binding-like beta-propeller repeat protein [Phycisphaerae bacterium]|nr:PQQ-binding-like beta-propeller repeat protein [Phycisphaerae bacterium]